MQKKIFNRWILEIYTKWLVAIPTIFTIAIVYIPQEYQVFALIGLFIVLLLCYVIVAVWAMRLKKTTIRIRDTKVVIKQGDIFTEEGAKIIPVNEYFDVDTEHGIIDSDSLHGQYLNKYVKQKDRSALYNNIIESLKSKKTITVDQERSGGQIRYQLGTIYNDKNGFYLLAYSRFDLENRAFLGNEDIAGCYLNMWNEVDILRGSQSIALPVLGAGGIVRFSKDYSTQQLIELILWSFRLSGIRLSKTAILTIVVHKSLVNEVDFLRLRTYSD